MNINNIKISNKLRSVIGTLTNKEAKELSRYLVTAR